MKISELTIEDLKSYANVFHVEEDKLFEGILSATISYIKGYTGLDNKGIDSFEDLTIALMILSNELYDNRTYTVKDDKVNPAVKSILDMHSINLL